MRFFPIVSVVGLLTLNASCNSPSLNNSLEPVDIDLTNLLSIDETWKFDTCHYWFYQPDSSAIDIPTLKDTRNHPEFFVLQVYSKKLSDSLEVKKYVEFKSPQYKKLSETDRYTLLKSAYLQSVLYLEYSFVKKHLTASFIEEIGTPEKMAYNKARVDSMLQYAEENNLYLCGTAADEALYKDVPFLPMPRSISVDSALIVQQNWINRNTFNQ